ncbi:hypothetical protein MPC4_60149 [Methylocella tundrae]|uniref:Uncharacterized protein n=1 Tax=Methylocella tundrae TaxID=227605 RepID=A0A8B6MAQ9_METTU|nr:hypothetical protein MPC1_4320002 [Methylocella tundrae]VTZ52060.1 hypothetical protein MPC4_60149 [Methylocella tundrae]
MQSSAATLLRACFKSLRRYSATFHFNIKYFVNTLIWIKFSSWPDLCCKSAPINDGLINAPQIREGILCVNRRVCFGVGAVWPALCFAALSAPG